MGEAGAEGTEATAVEAAEARRAFWVAALHAAKDVSPDELGAFLTWLVADKRRVYPADDVELLAVGMRAAMTALGRTKPTGEIGLHDEVTAVVLLLGHQWLGWPIPRPPGTV